MKNGVRDYVCRSFAASEEAESIVSGISCQNCTLFKDLKQTLADTWDFRERKARGGLFETQGHSSLMFRYNAKNDITTETKHQKLMEAQWWLHWKRYMTGGARNVLVQKGPNLSKMGASGIWREKEAARLNKCGSKFCAPVGRELEQGEGEVVPLIWNVLSMVVLRQFMGLRKKDGNCCEIEGTMMWVARLDTWSATVVTCLTEKEKTEDHPQQLHSDTYNFNANNLN